MLPKDYTGAESDRLPWGAEVPVSCMAGRGGRGSMEGTLETSPSSSQGGDLIPYLALRDLSSSHTFAPLDDVRGGLRADQWQLLLS